MVDAAVDRAIEFAQQFPWLSVLVGAFAWALVSVVYRLVWLGTGPGLAGILQTAAVPGVAQLLQSPGLQESSGGQTRASVALCEVAACKVEFDSPEARGAYLWNVENVLKVMYILNAAKYVTIFTLCFSLFGMMVFAMVYFSGTQNVSASGFELGAGIVGACLVSLLVAILLGKLACNAHKCALAAKLGVKEYLFLPFGW